MNIARPTDRPRRCSPIPGFARHGGAVAWRAGALLLTATACASAQTVTTVRENEFRSRWADYQVDRPAQQNLQQQKEPDETKPETEGGLLSAFGRSFNDYFRNGPLQVRAVLSSGWEFTNEETLRRRDPNGTDNSPFISPAFGLFYNVESGALTLSARYSAGYVYYLDQSYYAVNHNGGILSQTAGLDINLAGNRTNLRSNLSATYGNGDDIESGAFRDRLFIGEGYEFSYLVTDFTQVGTSGTLSYSKYSGGGVTNTSDSTINTILYGDYVITGKSRLRLELGAGNEHQEAGASGSSDRTYYQFVLRANYVPSGKLTFDAGLGFGYQTDSSAVDRANGPHPVYLIASHYVPTEKTAITLRFGYEGTDIEPELSLLAQWQPRPNTNLNFSVYQSNNFSTYIIAQNLTTRGILATIQQKFFDRAEVDLSAGAEQTRGYTAKTASGATYSPGTYYFTSIAFQYDFNSIFAFQTYYRGFTGQPGLTTDNQRWQSRASVSLRLTF